MGKLNQHYRHYAEIVDDKIDALLHRDFGFILILLLYVGLLFGSIGLLDSLTGMLSIGKRTHDLAIAYLLVMGIPLLYLEWLLLRVIHVVVSFMLALIKWLRVA